MMRVYSFGFSESQLNTSGLPVLYSVCLARSGEKQPVFQLYGISEQFPPFLNDLKACSGTVEPPCVLYA